MDGATMVEKITGCTMDCPDSCSLIVSTNGRGSVRIQGNPAHPFTSGFICAKIKHLPKRLTSSHRVVRPMLRIGSHWRSIGWDDALDLCAEKIDRAREEPSSILHFHGEGAKGVLKQANKLFFAMIGASRTKGSLCDAAGFIATLMDCGSRVNNDIEDLKDARRIVNWGKDLARSSIHTAAIVRQARRQGAEVLTVSPGGEGAGSPGDRHVRIRPGADRFLAAAVMRLLLERGAIPEDILSHTRNGETFQGLLTAHSLPALVAACDAKPADVERLFEIYAGGAPAATLIGTGLQRYKYGGENVRFINALAMVSGNIGRSGAGSYFHLHALTNLNHDWARGPAGRGQRTLYMATIGQSVADAAPPIRVIWVNGSNLINQAPDSRRVAQIFEKIPFKVVVDAFMTDTAQRADLLLPAALMLEQEDIVGSYLHHYIHYVDRVVEPPGDAKSDFWILSELGKRLDPPVILPNLETCLRASLDTPFLDISLETLKASKFVKANRPRVAYEGLVFDTPDGKYHFPTSLHPERKPPSGFPFRLLSLIRKSAMHSQILPEDQRIPVDLWVSPETAASMKIELQKESWLVSPFGRVRVRPHALDGLHPEALLTRRGTWMKLGGGINQVVGAELSDIGNGAPFYEQYVRIETDDSA